MSVLVPALPKIMVAPNGARRTRADHPAIPVTIEQTVETARGCFEAGATGLHAHVRDEDERHVLDAGLYRELIVEMEIAVPDMLVQITTEAVGIYTAPEQRKLVRDVMPKAVSVGLMEMLSDGDEKAAHGFYAFALESGIAVQHIVYSAEQLAHLIDCVARNIIPLGNDDSGLQLLFVLGRYTKDQQSSPDDLTPFLLELKKAPFNAHWAVCAFGHHETDCLVDALEKGGNARVGFENSLWNADGSLAQNNEERVELVARHVTV